MELRRNSRPGPVSYFGSRSGVEYRVDGETVEEVLEAAAQTTGMNEAPVRVVVDGVTTLEGEALRVEIAAHVAASEIYEAVRLDDRTAGMAVGIHGLRWSTQGPTFLFKSAEGHHEVPIAKDRLVGGVPADVVTAILQSFQMEISFRRGEWGKER